MRTLYIIAFTALGILIQFLFHAALEIQVITFFTEIVDPLMWGISWKALFAVHRVSAVVLFIGGAYVGFQEGQHWWRELYIKRKSGLWKIGRRV